METLIGELILGRSGRTIAKNVEVRCVEEIGPDDECPSGYYEFGYKGTLLRGLVELYTVVRVASVDGRIWTRY